MQSTAHLCYPDAQLAVLLQEWVQEPHSNLGQSQQIRVACFPWLGQKASVVFPESVQSPKRVAELIAVWNPSYSAASEPIGASVASAAEDAEDAEAAEAAGAVDAVGAVGAVDAT
jgi:hypothetical protein